MNKPTAILLLCLIHGALLPAQDSLSISEWLDRRTEALLPEAAQGGDFRPGWFREMEFRTETEDFETGKQEYLFRLSPSTPRIRRAQSRLIGLAREEINLSWLEFRAEVIKYVLEELLEIRRLRTELTVQERLLAVYLDEQTFVRGMLEENSYNVKDLLQVEGALRELQRDIQNNEGRLRALPGRELPPATGNLLSIPSLTARLTSVDWYGTQRALPSRDQLNIARVEAEMELEKAEKNRLLDFVQLRYNGPHSDLLQERLNVGIGLDLPTSSGKKMKLEELRVEQLLREQEVAQQRTLDSLRVNARLTSLQRQLEQWQLLNEDLARQATQLNRLLETGADIAYDSPDLYLFQQETVLKGQLDLLDLETGLYRGYLELLEETGVLEGEADLRGLWAFLLD